MKKFKSLFIYSLILAGVAMYSCEGPMGPAGKDGKDGIDGTDGEDGKDGQNSDAACKVCHNPNDVDLLKVQYQFSKHEYGEAAFEEAGSTGCGPCHLQEAFKYVCTNNIPATFTGSTNNYTCSSSTAYGEIGCVTCHNQLHTDSPNVNSIRWTTGVQMSMYAGTKTIDLAQKGGVSNLCVKCHQPRPFTNSNTDKLPLDYANLKNNPTAIFYSSTDPGTDVLKPGYRTHTHYGTAGAVFAGVGFAGIEFAGSLPYANSWHTSNATCQECHMATMNGKAGGHTFFAKGNFNGCNVVGCHNGNPISTSNATYWTNPRTEIKGLLDQLAAKLKVLSTVDGATYVEILNRNPDSESNLWVSNTTNKYDGYLNVYDPINNPNGLTNNNPTADDKLRTFKNEGSTSGWSAAQIATNNTLPKISLTNAQMGAIINFQLCLRDYSLGIHNFDYTKALLTNTIAVLP